VAQFHFVEDYEKLVAKLVRSHPIDEAMAKAVGGDFHLFGRIEAELLRIAGLRRGMRVVDLGCGSGRLAFALHNSEEVSYVGIDIIKRLLDYAKSKAPRYEFILHRELSIPQPDASADIVSAFSLFTHLLQAETYIYLEECKRILKPGGKAVFSFLEFSEPAHWAVFVNTGATLRTRSADHLYMFIDRGAIAIWASHLGFEVERIIDATTPVVDGGHALGQSVAVLRKPA
jgi:ubiquinone/menaquinone biosynthesis C-methylase UbiE